MPFEPHRLTDPQRMRALAHPVRLALMETLGLRGELTATQASEVVGASPSACSFHLRQLAKYGFVEETGTGRGRQRPWKLTRIGITFGNEEPADAETAVAVDALSQVMTDRYLERARRQLAARAELEEPWRHLTGTSQFTLYLTPAELEELNADVLALMVRHVDRYADPTLRPEGSRAIEVLTLGYPVD
jgi:DNA-binding transcriptional ArsR family regulator